MIYFVLSINEKLEYKRVLKETKLFNPHFYKYSLKVIIFGLLTLFVFCSQQVIGQFTPVIPDTSSTAANYWGWGTGGTLPFGGNTTAFSDVKHQYILLSTDLTSGGVVANDVLASIGFYGSGGTSKTYNGLTIYLKHTTATSINAFDGSGLTLVYQANSTVNNTVGWKDFTFTNGFTWNGTSNILVSICWNNSVTSIGVNTHYVVTSFSGPNRSYSQRATSGTGCNLTAGNVSTTVEMTRFGIKPKITSFTPTSACASSNQTVTITGKYFTGATAVSIGGTAASSFIVNNDTQITATIGSGTTGAISVTTPLGVGTSTTSITVKPKPVATANPSNQTICSGSTSSVSLIGNVTGTTFTWLTASNTNINGESTTAQSSSNINNTLSSSTTSPITLNYTVTPTASGCAGTAITVPITVNPIPIATASPSNETICSGSASNVLLTSNVIGTTFTWITASNASVNGESTTAQSSSNINNALTSNSTSLITLNYTATPIAAGCTGSIISIPITVKPKPIATANPSSQTICSGILPGISFTSNISGTTFSWSTVANSNIGGESTTPQTGANITDFLTNSTSSPITLNYSVTPTLAGCSGTVITVPLTVNPSVASISPGGPSTFCEGSSVTLNANTGTGLTYQWQLNNLPIVGQINSSLFVNTTGNYSVTVLNNYNCSSISNTFQVTVNPDPLMPIISISSPTIFCQGDSVLLSVPNDPNLSYQWQNNGVNILNSTSPILTVFNSGNYTLLATSTNNCTTGSSIESVTVNPLPSSDIFALSTTSFCEGDSVVLQGNYIVDGIYSWSNQNGIISNLNASSFTAFETSIYSYVVSDTNNCSNQSDTIEVNVNTHNPSEIYTTSLGPFNLNGITYFESGVYSQNLQTVAGCDSMLTIHLQIENISMVEISDECTFLIYPNPSKENIVYFKKVEECQVEIESIYDMYGRQIAFIQDENKVELLTEKKGVYFLMLNQNNIIKRYKFILD
jgi:hypothetical protein